VTYICPSEATDITAYLQYHESHRASTSSIVDLIWHRTARMLRNSGNECVGIQRIGSNHLSDFFAGACLPRGLSVSLRLVGTTDGILRSRSVAVDDSIPSSMCCVRIFAGEYGEYNFICGHGRRFSSVRSTAVSPLRFISLSSLWVARKQ
jgi:hypothetical protein